MFWSKKNKNTGKQGAKQQPRAEEGSGKPGKNSTAGQESNKKKNVGTSSGQRPDSQKTKSEKIREEALANARKAREALGDDTIQKIAAAMHKKQQSATEQAKAKIADSDADRVAAEILWMLEDKTKK